MKNKVNLHFSLATAFKMLYIGPDMYSGEGDHGWAQRRMLRVGGGHCTCENTSVPQNGLAGRGGEC